LEIIFLISKFIFKYKFIKVNLKQKKIFEVINALLQIKKFPEYFQDHTIRYGFLNYVAKYSLAADKYLITEKALNHLIQNNFLKNGSLRKGLKSKKNGFTYEHPIPSNIISSEILKFRENKNMINKILKWSDLIVVLTSEENLCLTDSGFERKMPNNWKFFKSNPFARYELAGLLEKPLLDVDVYGQVTR